MTAKRADPALDRAYEYIDSPLMSHRLVYRKHLSARIEGNYGVYRTTVQIARKLVASCTCPSEYWPCKHVRALHATWEANPGSFFDLEPFLKALEAKPRAELSDAFRQMILAHPENLGVLGVPGFEPAREAEDAE